MSQLDILPEEIVERILQQVVKSVTGATAAPSPLAPRYAVLLTCRKWYRIALPLFYHTVYIKGEKQAGQLLATLESSPVDFSLAQKAAENTQIGSFVRSLVISCPLSCPTLPRLVSQCTELTDLDICLDAKTFGVRYNPMPQTCGDGVSGAASSPTDAFLASLTSLKTVSHLTLRKDANVYLTLPKVGHFITHLAGCVRQWNDLLSIYIAFRLSDDAASTGVLPEQSSSDSAVKSPLTNLTHALAQSPRLESVTTHLPSVWNSVLVGLVGSGDSEPSGSDVEDIKSSNLKKIILLPGAGSPKPTATPSFSPRNSYTRHTSSEYPTTARTTIGVSLPGHGLGLSLSAPSPSISESKPAPLVKERDAPPPLPANSLYLSTAARHHPKLMELIRAGWTDAFSASALAGNTAWYGAGRGRAWTYAGE